MGAVSGGDDDGSKGSEGGLVGGFERGVQA